MAQGNNMSTDIVQPDLVSHGSDGNYTVIDSKRLRTKIITEYIYPSYEDEICNNLMQRKLWATMFSIFSSLTIIMICASTIVSFSVPQFPNIDYVSYLAGILGVIALMCERFAHYCSSQGSSSTQKVNVLLKSIGIHDSLPDTLVISPPDLSSSIQQQSQQPLQQLLQLLQQPQQFALPQLPPLPHINSSQIIDNPN